MPTRRSVLLASAATLVPTRGPPEPGGGGNAALRTLFDQLFQENLRLRPESATQLGLDKGANADLRAKLSEDGDTGRAAARAQTASQLRRLESFDRSALSQFYNV